MTRMPRPCSPKSLRLTSSDDRSGRQGARGPTSQSELSDDTRSTCAPDSDHPTSSSATSKKNTSTTPKPSDGYLLSGVVTDSVPSNCHGVLVAVGYTALAVDDRDLAAIEGYRWPWRRVGPDALGRIVRDHAAGDRELLAYADRLDQEPREQAYAVQAVAAERG